LEQIAKLSTTFCGVGMRSPLGVGAVNMPLGQRSAIDPEVHAQVLLKHAEAGAGFIYVPGCLYFTEEMMSEWQQRVKPRESYLRPTAVRFMKIETPGLDMPHGVYFLDTGPARLPNAATFDLVRRTIEILKKKRPEGVAIIASILPLGDIPESAVVSAKKVEELGVDLIEINVSCGLTPSIEGAVEYYLEGQYPLTFCGALVGDNLDLVEKIATDVVRAVNIPVGVKLTPETGYPRVVGLVRRLREAGVKYVQVSNFAPAIAPPDIYNRGKPRWSHVDGNPFVGATGDGLRLACYKNVAGIAKFAPGIDIAAGAGLLTSEHAIEVMMLGARLVEFCTGMLLKGRDLLKETIDFLGRYVDEQGYQSVGEFVGLGIQYIKPLDRVNIEPMVAEVDPAKCQQSGRCTDNICIAMERNGGKARVITEACDGCGLCVLLCPNQAIKLVTAS
jgi:dihydropyrimidine dehydrogenase (NAD+) subunit PreA